MASFLGKKTLEIRRRQEVKARDLQLALMDDQKSLSKACFELSTTKKLEARTKQEIFEQKVREKEVSLLARRQQLADLYNFERQSWHDEFLNNEESIEDRKQK